MRLVEHLVTHGTGSGTLPSYMKSQSVVFNNAGGDRRDEENKEVDEVFWQNKERTRKKTRRRRRIRKKKRRTREKRGTKRQR